MGKISSRMVFEIITIIGIVTFAVISLTPSTAKQQSVQLDHGRMSYSGAGLKVQANSLHRTGGACKATSARVR